MGLSIPMMIDTFLARKDLLFGTHFGAGKLAALLMVLGLFWIFIKNKLKTAIFFYACMVCVLIIGILVVRKTTVYYFLRQFLPFFDRTTLMPTALLLLVFAVSGLCALGADFILFVSERILNRAKQRYHGLPKEMITSVICIALVTGITAWNMRFMKFPTYDYDKRLADYPHLREAARLIDHPLARLFMLGNSSWFTAWQGKIFVDYGIRSFNINRGITTIKESSVITNDAQAMDPAFSRFLSLAGVQYILSANKEDDLDLVKTVVWKNWRTHNEAFDIRQLSGEKTIYVYEPKLPPKERYRIYRDAILIVGDPGHTGKIALMLMNNESIDPLHTLILEITRNVLSNIDSKLWDFIDLVVDTDRTGDTGSIMDIKKRKIPVVDVVEIRDHAHLLKGRQSDVVPVIEHGNSYAVLDVSGLPAGILFAANTYYMGWQSVVGNKKNQAMKANYAFQGYIIDHPDIVRLKFWPGKIYFGMLLSCIGVLVICGLIIYGRLLSNVSAVINE
jgi:hypothetical protein